MIKYIKLSIFLLISFSLSAQAIVGGGGFCAVAGNPNNISVLNTVDSRYFCTSVKDTVTGNIYTYVVGNALGSRWVLVNNSNQNTSSFWNLNGNTGTTAGTNYIGTTDAQPLVLKIANTEMARFLTNGNVGIGTATPASISGGYTTLGMKGVSGSGFSIASNTGTSYFYGGASLAMETPTFYNIQTNGVDIARFNANGLGIRTTAPTASFDVDGNARIRNLSIGASTDSVVTADANGVLYKQSMSTVTGWVNNGNNQYSAKSGNVSIGTSFTPSRFTVLGDNLGSAVGSVSNIASFWAKNTSDNFLNILNKRHTTGTDWATTSTRIQMRVDNTDMGYVEFNPINGNYALGIGVSSGEAIRVQQNRAVGINTTTPQYPLEVNGDASATRLRYTQNVQYANPYGASGNVTDQSVLVRNKTDGFMGEVNLYSLVAWNGGNSSGNLTIGNKDNTPFDIRTNNISRLGVSNSGVVSIYNLPSGTTTDSIITVNAAGNLNKRTSGDVTGWGVNGTSTYNYAGGNVGIGTLLPQYKLDVDGRSLNKEPLRLKGLTQGNSTDSILSSENGVVKRITPASVVNRVMSDSCMVGITSLATIAALTGTAQSVALPRTIGDPSSYYILITPHSDTVGNQSYTVGLNSLTTTSFVFGAYNGTSGIISYKIQWKVCPNGY